MALPLAPILGALTVYAVSKVIVALGFGFVVYTGISELQDQFYNAVNTNLGGTAANILMIATLFGFIEYSKIILGAITMRLSLMAFKRFMPI